MPNDEWEDQENDSDLVKNLRKQIREGSKKQTEAEDRATAAEGRYSERVLKDALNAKGVNPKAAKFLVKDGVDATDENAVASWLEENSDLFPAKTTEGDPPQEPAVDQATVHGYQQLGSTGQLQRPADINRLVEVERKLPANATPEQVLAEMRAAGL